MKKILCLFAAAFFSLCAFAEPKGTGLTDGDVKSWAKNLSAIQTELDAIGVDKDDVASASKKDREKAVKVLNGYGITGANCIEKFIMINQCSAVIVAESELSSADPQSLSMMKAMGIDPLAQLKAGVNSKDYKVVEANKKAVAAAVKGFAETASDSSSKGQEPYEDYDPAKELRAMQKSLLKESVDRQNKDPLAAEVKSGYEKITKSRGDGGFLYKALDSKNASKYKKLAVPEKKLLISYGEDLTDSPDGYHGYENCAGIEGTVDIKNKNVSLRFGWEETGFDDSPAGAGVKTDRIIKDLSWTIKSVELYGYDYGRWCRMREYVVTTKEGPVLHLWCDTGDDTYSCDVNAKGLAEGKYVKPSEDSDYTVCTFTGWHWNEED